MELESLDSSEEAEQDRVHDELIEDIELVCYMI